jgi:glycosyltransferase involved in cell wall biosynthesis
MNIWIIQTGEPLHIDKNGIRPMRAMNLSNELLKKGHKVTLWTSDFDHFTKSHRFGKIHKVNPLPNLEIILIYSRGYTSHIGFARIFDHLQLGLNLFRLIKKELPPDVAFIGYPPIEAAWVATHWLKRKKVKTILDVKDAWPESILNKLPKLSKPVAKILLTPYYLMMFLTFKNSFCISAPTEEFLKWCLDKTHRKNNGFDFVFPLTSPEFQASQREVMKSEKFLDSNRVKADEKFRATFIGSLNHSFDFDPIIEAAKNTQFQFVIAGDGPYAEILKQKTRNLKNFIMLGWIDQVTANTLLARSKVMIAPFKELPEFKRSTTNKFYDAMKFGLPIVSSISGTTGDLIVANRIGRVYSNKDISDLTNVLSQMFSNSEELDLMSRNTKNLYRERFEFNVVYGDIVEKIENFS